MAQKHLKAWIPNKPVSEGANTYHNAVVDAEYYNEVLKEYGRLAKAHIRKGDLVVEFGAGTGVSALLILKEVSADFKLWLVDNSAAWLGKAYSVLKDHKNVACFLLAKTSEGYETLSEAIGAGSADKVFSANTVHLIPDLTEVFGGIHQALKPTGIFVFESGNIDRKEREKGVLLVDDTIKRVHDIAIDILRKNDRYRKYRQTLEKRISEEMHQRSLVFPKPRLVEEYQEALRNSGFIQRSITYKQIKFKYADWLAFLRVRRLQAGILPEIGGKDPSSEEEHDRDEIITQAATILFKELAEKNPKADLEGFTAEIVYVVAQKGDQMKTALITGASRGIGKACALELARNGFQVAVNYHSNEREAAQVVKEIEQLGVKAKAFKADVASHDSVKAMIKEVHDHFGRIDVLVNNAGIIRDRTLKKMEPKEWNDVIQTNLTGVFYVTKECLSYLREGGRIINISSIIGQYGNFGQTNYAAAKAGLFGFTKSLAKELGPKKITVNAVAPGFVKTDIVKDIGFIKEKIINFMTPLKEIAQPEDIANVVSFLASERSRYITGTCINVDGGLAF